MIFATLLAEAVVLSTRRRRCSASASRSASPAPCARVAGWSDTLGPLGSFIVTAPVIVQGVFLSLFVGMLAGVVPSCGAARKPVVQTLHEVF